MSDNLATFGINVQEKYPLVKPAHISRTNNNFLCLQNTGKLALVNPPRRIRNSPINPFVAGSPMDARVNTIKNAA